MSKAIKITKTKAQWIVKNATKIETDRFGGKTYHIPFLYGTSLNDVMIDCNGVHGNKGDGLLSFDIEVKDNATDILSL